MFWVRCGSLGCFAAALLVACGSTSTTASPSGRAFNPPTATATSSAAPHSPVAAGPLSGTWSGKYSGAYTGTFTLTWTQTGSELIGSIQLTSPSATVNIVGMVKADTITFSTNGSPNFTYEGTSSGNSMSGQYHAGANGAGSWSATKT